MQSYRQTILSRISREVPELGPIAFSDDTLASQKHLGIKPKTEGVQYYRHASVLVGIVDHPDNPSVLLTRRADHLGTHSGQVAFPGGKVETGETSAEAALREAEEEIGLKRDYVEIVGYLDPFETGTGFYVRPVLGFVTPGFTLTIHEGEVAEVFEVPLAFLMDGSNHEEHRTMIGGRERVHYSMPYNGQNIWGATAGMLRTMYLSLFADSHPVNS